MCPIDAPALWLRAFGALTYVAGLTCEELIADAHGRLLLLLPFGECRQTRDRRVLAAVARVLLARTRVHGLLTNG